VDVRARVNYEMIGFLFDRPNSLVVYYDVVMLLQSGR
jgi:hypothetical protein